MIQKNLIGAAVALACLTAGNAMATPLTLLPGASGAVPVYDGRTPDTTTLLAAACGYFDGASCSTGTTTGALATTGGEILDSTGGFLEAAGTTQLNPFGASDVAIAFIFGGADVSLIQSVTLSSLAGYSTAVEACGPMFGSEFEGCTTGGAGNAAHSAGAGDSVTFTNLGMTEITLFGIESFPATDGYVVYTNAPASALVDPNNFTVDLTSGVLSFAGLGLTPPSSGGGPPPVAEPDTLALLGLGVAALGVGLARRRRGVRS